MKLIFWKFDDSPTSLVCLLRTTRNEQLWSYIGHLTHVTSIVGFCVQPANVKIAQINLCILWTSFCTWSISKLELITMSCDYLVSQFLSHGYDYHYYHHNFLLQLSRCQLNGKRHSGRLMCFRNGRMRLIVSRQHELDNECHQVSIEKKYLTRLPNKSVIIISHKTNRRYLNFRRKNLANSTKMKDRLFHRGVHITLSLALIFIISLLIDLNGKIPNFGIKAEVQGEFVDNYSTEHKCNLKGKLTKPTKTSLTN